MVALLIVGLVLCALTADYFVLRLRAFSALQSRQPSDVFIAPGHLWLVPESAGLLRVGADAMASLLLGQPEKIDWPSSGRVRCGDPVVVLHRGSRRLTLCSPMSGELVERNNAIAAAAVARDPMGTWLVRVKPDDMQASLARTVSGERLREWSRRELDRLRSFLLAQLPRTSVGATAADGGPLGPELASLLDDETWERAIELVFDAQSEFTPAPQLGERP